MGRALVKHLVQVVNAHAVTSNSLFIKNVLIVCEAFMLNAALYTFTSLIMDVCDS